MSERYQVEIHLTNGDSSLVVVTAADNGRRLSGSTTEGLAPQMVAILIEDHRERRFAEPSDPLLEEAKQRRREEAAEAAMSVFSRDEGCAWLMAPNAKLGGRRPLAIAGSGDDGLAAVKKLLYERDTTEPSLSSNV